MWGGIMSCCRAGNVFSNVVIWLYMVVMLQWIPNNREIY